MSATSSPRAPGSYSDFDLRDGHAARHGGRRARLVAAGALTAAELSALAAVWLAGARLSVAGAPEMLQLLGFAGVVLTGLKAATGLYPGFGLHPEARLRKQVLAWAGAGAIVTLAALQLAGTASAALHAVWLCLVILLPVQAIGAMAVRGLLQWLGAWGVPVDIDGEPAEAAALAGHLAAHPELGFRMADADERAHLLLWAGRALPDRATLDDLRQSHDEVILVSDLPRLRLSGIHPSDHGGQIGLRLVRAQDMPLQAASKRLFDLALTLAVAALVLPVVLVCAMLIRIADPGPAFHIQIREGRNGRPIGVLKLRTMYLDADAMLAALLQSDAGLRAEWEAHFKLRNDPRILPGIGHFLRTTSLDELPQLLNILRGDMSLVGPRPFPDYHLSAMPADFRARRASVVPGLTGLWQISERSGSDLAGQEELDDYYIAGRSFWADLSICLRTFSAVIGRRGAY